MTSVDKIWNDKFSVGIKQLDDHHKHLLGVIIDLQDSLLPSKMNHEVIKDSLNELFSYTKYHFTAEEKLLNQFQFSGIQDHVKQHKEFINKIEWFVVKYEQNQKDINKEMLLFLKDWLVRHILKADKEYSSFLVSKGVS